jgi:hypothetical protein
VDFSSSLLVFVTSNNYYKGISNMTNIEMIQARLRGLHAEAQEINRNSEKNMPTPRYIKDNAQTGLFKIVCECTRLNLILNQLKAAVRRSTFQ